MSPHICLSCGSENVAEVEYVQAYFKEGEYSRLRTICVQHNESTGWYHATCPEIAGMNVVGMSENELLAIKALGDLLKEHYHIELRGEHF